MRWVSYEDEMTGKDSVKIAAMREDRRQSMERPGGRHNVGLTNRDSWVTVAGLARAWSTFWRINLDGIAHNLEKFPWWEQKSTCGPILGLLEIQLDNGAA